MYTVYSQHLFHYGGTPGSPLPPAALRQIRKKRIKCVNNKFHQIRFGWKFLGVPACVCTDWVLNKSGITEISLRGVESEYRRRGEEL